MSSDKTPPSPAPARGDAGSPYDVADDLDADPAATRARAWVEPLRAWLWPQTPQRAPGLGRRLWLFVVFVIRRFLQEDRAPGMAAVLTINTLLSLVPLVGVVLFFVGLIGETAGPDKVLDAMRGVLPDPARAEALTEEVMRLASNVTIARLGAWGFAVALVLAFALFTALTRHLNQIWRVTRRRNLLITFTMFYTLATLAPGLFLFSLAQPLIAGLSQSFVWPLLSTATALILINRFVPYTAVHWSAAAVGGFTSAVAIEIGKFGFEVYASEIASYESFYGSLAFLPLFVVWTYLSWIVVLLGAEITFVVQHRRSIALQGFINRFVLDSIGLDHDPGRTAARLLLAVCDHFARRNTGIAPSTLSTRFRIGLDRTGQLLGHLARHGYLLETERPQGGYVPARPLEQIRLQEVLELFGTEQTAAVRDDKLSNLFRALDDARLGVVADTTYADLVPAARRLATADPQPAAPPSAEGESDDAAADPSGGEVRSLRR